MLPTLRYKMNNNVKTGCEYTQQHFYLATARCEHGNEPSGFIKNEKLIIQCSGNEVT